ncbi:MAG: hypothetical protein OHK0052_25150 [Anaerolineales bacterium]
MLTAIKQQVTVRPDGGIDLHLPLLKPGETANLIVLVERITDKKQKTSCTAADLLASGVVGLWANRQDIADSAAFARKLRESAENRKG